MDALNPNKLSKVLFNTEEERQRKAQELEDIAKSFQAEFESNFVPANANVQDENGKFNPVFKVDAGAVSSYLRKLGTLADDASGYSWGLFPRPQLTAQLRYLTIEGSLRLAKSSLPGLILYNVAVLGEADFTGARFLRYFNASKVNFSGDTYFNHSVFLAGISFDRSTFSGHVYFSGAKLLGHAEFEGTAFTGDGYFIGASFRDGVSFSKSSFRARALFHRASFSGINDFEEAVFNDVADFDDTQFSGLGCRGASFLGTVGFQDATFSGAADFSGSTFSSMANFGGAGFAGRASFLDCQFKAQTIFSRSSFALCPRFHEAVLHQDTSFSGGRFASMFLTARLRQTVRHVLRKPRLPFFKSGRGKRGEVRINWDAEARAYRTLKLHMSKFQAQHEAAHFFAGEMRSRRREHGLRHPIHYVASQMYDVLSEFGQSAGRVLLWLILINSAFTYCYYLQAQEDVGALRSRFAVATVQTDAGGGGEVSAWDEARPWAALSLQSLNPVAFLSPKNTWVRVYDGRIFAVGVGQSLLNLTLIILLGISLRGQFRRGAGGGD